MEGTYKYHEIPYLFSRFLLTMDTMKSYYKNYIIHSGVYENKKKAVFSIFCADASLRCDQLRLVYTVQAHRPDVPLCVM